MQYWYINLTRRTDRNEAQIKGLDERGFPKHIIRRLTAMDREHYASPMALASAASQDGFPTFELIPKNLHINYWAGCWSYMRALREIADQDKVVMLALDDWLPSYTYEECQELLSERPDFDILQFSWYMKHKDRFYEQASENWCHLARTTGQEINVYTPKGAKWLLRRCRETPGYAAEFILYRCSFDYSVKIYHHADPPRAVTGIEGCDIHDSTTEICYQGNYHKNGDRITEQPQPQESEGKSRWQTFYS